MHCLQFDKKELESMRQHGRHPEKYSVDLHHRQQRCHTEGADLELMPARQHQYCSSFLHTTQKDTKVDRQDWKNRRGELSLSSLP